MKKVSVLLLFILLSGFLKVNLVQSKIILDPASISSALLMHGYKGEFCNIGTETDLGFNPLEIYLGEIPQASKQKLDNAMHTASCVNNTTMIVIVGDVRLIYTKGYQGDETFFIFDNNMYRSGSKFDYPYSNQITGGTWIEDTTHITYNHVELLGSNFFFKANYQSQAVNPNSVLTNTGYIRHYSVDGKEDGELLVLNNSIYRLVTVIEEKNNIDLFSYLQTTPSIEVSPTLNLIPTEVISPTITQKVTPSPTINLLPTLTPTIQVTPTTTQPASTPSASPIPTL